MKRNSGKPTRRGFFRQAIFLGIFLCFWQPAYAEEAKLRGVVELFTSQGCNSCPPADAVIGELARSDDVLALAYHVDYWDYLGWKDELASAQNTARQRGYARTLERSSVYTPQAVINGRRDMNGAQRNTVLAALDEMSRSPSGLSVNLAIRDTGDSIAINIDGRAAPPGEVHVVLVDFLPMRSVSIRAGENKGRKIDYWNAVVNIQTIGMWHGGTETLEMPKSKIAKAGGGCAVLLQAVDRNGNPGAILGAAMLPAAQEKERAGN